MTKKTPKSCFRFLSEKDVARHNGFAGLMRHDSRRQSVYAGQQVNSSLTASNQAVIMRTLEDVREADSRMVKKLTGRRMQKTTLFVREAVVELPENASIDTLLSVGQTISKTPIFRSMNQNVTLIEGKKRMSCAPVLDKNDQQEKSSIGIELFAAFLHVDEGHWETPDGISAGLSKRDDGKWIDGRDRVHDPEAEGFRWKCHRHGHLWYNVISPKTGKTIRLSADELSQIQTIVANALGMERGQYGSERNHLSTDLYRTQKIAEALDKENRILEEIILAKKKQRQKYDVEIHFGAEMNRLILENLRRIARKYFGECYSEVRYRANQNHSIRIDFYDAASGRWKSISIDASDIMSNRGPEIKEFAEFLFGNPLICEFALARERVKQTIKNSKNKKVTSGPKL